tara:strand:- start:434 stop:832 length:399 start_codon:yes stop_codon:yes gene_type:complete
MINLTKYFTKGLKNTLLLKDNSGTSHNGPWISLADNTVLERWHTNDFASVDYTVSVDFDNRNKEVIKFLVTAVENNAFVVEYARNNTNIDIITVDALVNNSYVDIIVNPKIPNLRGSKIIFTAQYFQTQTSS